MKTKTCFAFITALVLAASVWTSPCVAKDNPEKTAKKMAKWQEEAKTAFDMKYDKFTTQSIITSTSLGVANRGILSTNPKPDIDMVISYSYKGVEMTAKPATFDMYLKCEIFKKYPPIHRPTDMSRAGAVENPNNQLNFLVDDQPLAIDPPTAYSMPSMTQEILKYTLTLDQFNKLASASKVQARLGDREFEVKDFPLVVLKEILSRINAVK